MDEIGFCSSKYKIGQANSAEMISKLAKLGLEAGELLSNVEGLQSFFVLVHFSAMRKVQGTTLQPISFDALLYGYHWDGIG